MRHAAVYRRRDKLILHPDGRTTAGVFIGIDPFIVLPSSSSASVIGATLRNVLAGSKEGLRHPQPHEWDAVAAPLYATAGVKSWGAFARGAVLANVEGHEDVIRVLPQENRGARDGFQPLGLPVIEVPAAATDHELGEAVLKALDLAQQREPHGRDYRK